MEHTSQINKIGDKAEISGAWGAQMQYIYTSHLLYLYLRKHLGREGRKKLLKKSKYQEASSCETVFLRNGRINKTGTMAVLMDVLSLKRGIFTGSHL